MNSSSAFDIARRLMVLDISAASCRARPGSALRAIVLTDYSILFRGRDFRTKPSGRKVQATSFLDAVATRRARISQSMKTSAGSAVAPGAAREQALARPPGGTTSASPFPPPVVSSGHQACGYWLSQTKPGLIAAHGDPELAERNGRIELCFREVARPCDE